MEYSVLELCAGGGGQSLGYEQAGFRHVACIDYEPDFCKTILLNRPTWRVVCQDIRDLDGARYCGCCDVIAGGVPCPPFSIAGKQEGENDERDMFPAFLQIVKRVRPRGVQIENVKGLAMSRFAEYRQKIVGELEEMGYKVSFRVLEASDYGVPQLRPRFVLVALSSRDNANFQWPGTMSQRATVGDALYDLWKEKGWQGADRLRLMADQIAPTLVGGSKKHGGPDLGPTRAREAWATLGIDGKGIADCCPDSDAPVDFQPRLTIRMAARIQGFPDDWKFYGGKTVQYRQVGNAFPPPVAKAVASAIRDAFETTDKERNDHA